MIEQCIPLGDQIRLPQANALFNPFGMIEQNGKSGEKRLSSFIQNLCVELLQRALTE